MKKIHKKKNKQKENLTKVESDSLKSFSKSLVKEYLNELLDIPKQKGNKD